jgi:hypothetical protein
MAFHSLVNTGYFSEAAKGWVKNGGRYTDAPVGSRDYHQYWEEQEKRCLYGYKVGDLWIPGRFYFYLNFFPMSRVPEATLMRALEERRSGRKGTISVSTAEKTIDFPKFWEIDYEWWNFKHIAWYGGKFMGIESEGGKHMCCLKTRGAGFSYKEAADGIYNYNFIDGSKSYFFAGAEPYLVGDAIMDKVQGGLDWLNQYCTPWYKNRQKKYTITHQRASYVDDFNRERGSFSEIIAQIVDKPSKTRGKRGRKASFEEGGSFPHMEDALEVCLGSMREGSVYVGQVTVFGTGGEQGPGIQGLENVFNSPESWDMLAFPNIYDEGMQHTSCGYFVPCYRADSWFMDENGNVDVAGAIKSDEKERQKKKKSGKPKDLDRRKAEYPRNPSEALQRLTLNGFNIAEIDAQINRIRSDKAIQGLLRHGEFVTSEAGIGGYDFDIKPKHVARPIEHFPHNNGDDLEGCVTIVQRPYQDQKGNVPAGMYIITFDGIAKEESEDKTSLFSFKVWKQENFVDSSYTGLPVAWCAGRPRSLNKNFERLFAAAEYYNAEIQGEIAGGGQMVVNYARTHRKLHRLKKEPDMTHNKELASKSAGNSMLMNMPTDRKLVGISYLEDWHVEPRGVDEKGNVILTIHRIYDIAWLLEMKKFDPSKLKGNYDRISDALIAMFELKERIAQLIGHRRASKKILGGRPLFGASGPVQGTTSAY